MKQLSIFEQQEIEERLNKMITPCKWYGSIWNINKQGESEWYVYSDINGNTLSDDYGRHLHNGTMLPMVINKSENEV